MLKYSNLDRYSSGSSQLSIRSFVASTIRLSPTCGFTTAHLFPKPIIRRQRFGFGDQDTFKHFSSSDNLINLRQRPEAISQTRAVPSSPQDARNWPEGWAEIDLTIPTCPLYVRALNFAFQTSESLLNHTWKVGKGWRSFGEGSFGIRSSFLTFIFIFLCLGARYRSKHRSKRSGKHKSFHELWQTCWPL